MSIQEPFKAYITKYALTKGILVEEVTLTYAEGMVKTTGQWITCYRRGEWFLSAEEARANAVDRAQRKLKSLEKQRAKIEARIAQWTSAD